jgi:outer membrane protein OmpA-like peptidoglycan-associated protein
MEKLSRIHVFIIIFLGVSISKNTFGQNDLPILENFETDSVWDWKPWENRTNNNALKTRNSAHSGRFGLDCTNGCFVIRKDKQIGQPGQVISWWIRFQKKTRASCGFGFVSLPSEHGYYLCVDPSTNTLHFASSPDYTYPLLKVRSQTYKLNVWYRVEVSFNTPTNVTGRLFSTNGKTVLNSLTIEIPDLSPGGISFDGLSLHVDDIRGGTRKEQLVKDTGIIPKLGEPLILKNIAFESNKSMILEKSFIELDKLVVYLKQNPTLKIEIVGHTDSIGKEEDNKDLSEARARAVADYLIGHNINKSNIVYKGLGSSRSIATNATEEGRQINRRVECILNY